LPQFWRGAGAPTGHCSRSWHPAINEAIAGQRLHFRLGSSVAEVRIRRAMVKVGLPPKTKYGWREVRLPAPLVYRLRDHMAGTA
jgi:hypothetical protein